jgi:glycosyltransferase involved in cell wall biosynthesis
VEEFPFSSEPGTYFAFVGRVSAEKRLDWAIAVAEATGIPLKIAARIENEAYFEREIVPHLNPPAIEYLGLLDENSKRHLLCNALALLLPIDWPEPFGLTFIESLACGTPVLTCPRGAATEIIRDGYTGFLRPGVAGLIEASGYINSLSRTACRETAMTHFHSERMVERYEQLYARLRAAGSYE